MNETVARFAAMAERAAERERATSRRPGESDQAALDRLVADELASLDNKDAPPPPAPDLFEDSRQATPKTNDARGRAIAYVERLISRYTDLRRSPYGYKVNVTAVIANLRHDLALMQARGPEGDSLARRWDFFVGDLA